MKRHNRVTVFILVIAVITAVLGGCGNEAATNMVVEGNSNNPETPSKTITFFGYKVDTISLTAVESALQGFMDINPDIQVTYEGLKGQTYWDALEKRSASGNLDDIFNVDHDHLKALSDGGKLVDLSGLSTIDNYSNLPRSQFIEEDGSVYFVPVSLTTYGLYVNLDLLEQHEMEPPSNLGEFTQACDYFADQGIAPLIINNFNSFRSLVVAKSLYPIYQMENPAEEIRKFNQNRASLVEALRPGIELFDFMLGRDWIDREEALETAQTSDDLALFVEGNRPFMVSGGWASPRVASMEPDFEYAVYPLPVLDDGRVLVMELGACISVNAESDNLSEALKFVEYFTQKDVMWQYCDSESNFTPIKDDRVPTDPTIEPSMPSATEEMVMGSDYGLELPLDAALRECGIQMMQGLDVDGAMELLAESIVLNQD